MLLTRVPSRWLEVCHGSSRLWDHVHIADDADYGHQTPRLGPILTRSGVLPLSVEIGMRALLFDLLWSHRDRLADLNLDTITFKLNLPQRIFRSKAPLPILSSPTINVMEKTPARRRRRPWISATSFSPSTFPFVSVAVIAAYDVGVTHILLSLRESHDIVTQCTMLEDYELGEFRKSDDIQPALQVYELKYLQWLEIDFEKVLDPGMFLTAFSYPNLHHLELSASHWTAEILQDLYRRSNFKFEHLVLDLTGLQSSDLVQIICHFSTLQTLSFYIGIEHLNPALIPDMAESLSAHAGDPDSAFPALRRANLRLSGPRFSNEIETRLAAACATGLVRDSHAQHRKA
ncbi:hypothetical protein B0H17DRAFT_1201363 [Mycena rosella]|uniref:Uncharacterized protein n=1 Tax=Mycena rosella TaxID=1033263 RepID=A0AAD7GJL6_MYCRO|nr:hypothetical protein B0H17DRAFT_1201363 [Mycena rosella]